MIFIRLLIKCNYLTIDGYKDKEKYRERKEISMVFWRGEASRHRTHGGLTPSPYWPHPRPLSEWRGEWYVRLPLWAGPSPNPSPAGRCVICEVTPTGLLVWGVDSFFSHRAHRVHGGFWHTFRAHRTPPAYRVHRALLLMLARIRDNK